MRQAGVLDDEAQAQRFADYLYALGITSKVDRDGGGWAIWVHDEEKVAKASEELAAFRANPDDAKYATAQSQARTKRQSDLKREEQARRNMIDMRRRWDRSPAGPTPVTMMLLVISIAVAVLTNLGSAGDGPEQAPARGLANKLMFVPTSATEEVWGNDGRLTSAMRLHVAGMSREEAESYIRRQAFEPIRRGEVWRLVTPIFLHFGAMHLLFNMWMLWDIGRLVEGRLGSLKFFLLVLLIAVVSNFAQFYITSLYEVSYAFNTFGGMSGVLFGLLGYAWMKSRYDPAAEIFVHPNTVLFMMIWLVVCALGLIGHVANWAHSMGLAVGMAIGIAPYAWRRLAARMRRQKP
jgi:rhomboid protease GlpG